MDAHISKPFDVKTPCICLRRPKDKQQTQKRGQYDTPGVSHVGIYVGGGKMLHCGDPIQYADINTSYWQSHFYAFGRPPYN